MILRRHTIRLPRRGFTLLELVCAASLTAVLLAGVVTSMTLFVRIEQTSEDRLVAAELSRNLLRQLEWDLRRIPVHLPAEFIEESQTTTAGLLAANDPESGLMAEAEVSEAVGDPVLFGDSSTLALRFEPRLDHQAVVVGDSADEMMTDVSQMRKTRLVQWTSPEIGFWTTSILGEEDQAGLMRAVGLIDIDNALLDWTNLLRVPEVESLFFEYLDQDTWVETWDSSEIGTLPQAIRATVLISVSSEESAETASYSRTFLLPGGRFVVPGEEEEGLE